MSEKKNQKLSVIVPIYNAEMYLNRCIQSILNQTYKNIELILVDDGSNDNSFQICKKWAERDDRVCAFNIKNGGPSNARNYGLRIASGRFIAFVDADDFLNLEMYEEMIRSLVNTNCGMVVCRWTTHNLDTEVEETVNIGSPGIIKASELKKIIAANDNIGGGGYLWNKVIDRNRVNASLKDNVQFRSELKIYEDKIWLMEILDYINEVILIDTIGYNYEIKQNSLSHGDFLTKIKDFVEAWDVIETECFHGITSEAIDKYKAVVIIFWFWEARKEGKSASIIEFWSRQRIFVKKILKKLSIKSIIKFFILDFILKLDGARKLV